ncbi:hypothetical protein ABIE61_003527 [Marinobacterium sp. MBR-111]|jgi:hypothetical protein|uniref:hypothetical protein n=1 Tax=Marinobacterium sp. MBR-111 TaxID=3156463 RepID=UPI003397ABDB
MPCLIGDKGIFAIEFEIRDKGTKPMGIIRIWLDGHYIGTFDDVNILTTTLHQLDRVSYESVCSETLDKLDPKDVYQLIKSDTLDGAGRHFLSLGESFDDFSVVLYGCDKNLVFVWELNENHFFDYPGYPEEVQYACVPVNYFANKVELFKKKLVGNSDNKCDTHG